MPTILNIFVILPIYFCYTADIFLLYYHFEYFCYKTDIFLLLCRIFLLYCRYTSVIFLFILPMHTILHIFVHNKNIQNDGHLQYEGNVTLKEKLS